jgi:phosphoglycerate dehydrogenase-like enzyme
VEPQTRDREGVRQVLLEADGERADFTGQLRLGADEAAVGADVAFIQQVDAGVETIDIAAWTQRGVPVANTGGAARPTARSTNWFATAMSRWWPWP